MKITVLALSALAAVGLSSGTASAQYVQRSYGPGISVGVVTPGGFSFGYSNVRPAFVPPVYYPPAYYPQPRYYVPGHYDYHNGHYHYHPGHYHRSPYHRH